MRTRLFCVSRCSARRTLAAALFLVPTTLSGEEPLDLIHRLAATGQIDYALSELRQLPDDGGDPFAAGLLEGALLARLGQMDAAATRFLELDENFPGRSETLNNLAVVRARQRGLRPTLLALDAALAAYPVHPALLDNLRLLNDQLADRLASPSAEPTLVDLVLADRPTRHPPVLPAPMTPPSMPPLAVPTTPPTDEAATPVASQRRSSSTERSGPPRAPRAEEPRWRGATPPPLSSDTDATSSGDSADPTQPTDEVRVLAHTEAWATAWREQRPEDYLAFYAVDYRPPGFADRDAWAASRRAALAATAYIWLDLASPRVERRGDRLAVRFGQRYESDRFRDTVLKELIWARRDGEWRIVEERVVTRSADTAR